MTAGLMGAVTADGQGARWGCRADGLQRSVLGEKNNSFNDSR